MPHECGTNAALAPNRSGVRSSTRMQANVESPVRALAAPAGVNEEAGRAGTNRPKLNPFIGLRPCDVLDTVRQVGEQTVRQPGLLVEQTAALTRELVAALAGTGGP